MCGINGIVLSSRTHRKIDQHLIERMRDVLAHRGPDDRGLFMDGSLEGPAGVGHRRLSIVDVAGGRPAMANEDGSLHLVYNGEIYHPTDLRGSLEAGGPVNPPTAGTEEALPLSAHK